MSHADLVLHVRELAHRLLRRRSTGSQTVPKESFLVRDGHYCGRRFRLEKTQAVWLFDAGQIQLFNADNQLVDTVEITAELAEGQLQAA